MRNDITVRGKWMYPRDAVAQMARLVRGELIDLAQFDLTDFALDDVNDAVAYAGANAGPLRLTVLRPDWGGAGAQLGASRRTRGRQSPASASHATGP